MIEISEDMKNRQEASLSCIPAHLLEKVGISPGASFEEAVTQYKWGSYGPEGMDPLQHKRLVDCDTEHLENILATQQIPEFTRRVILAILRRRYAVIPEPSRN